jgi:AraC-like DNA-binding protein/quercetin dioxygenase-like cupin family protein
MDRWDNLWEKEVVASRFTSALPTICSMGDMIFDPIWSQKMHVDHRCELIHVVQGEVLVITNQGRMSAGPGDVLLIPSGIPHRDQFNIRSGLEVFMVSFQWQLEKSYFAEVPWRTLPLTTPAARLEIANGLGHLKTDFTGRAPVDQFLAQTHLLAVLLRILAEVLRNRHPRRAPKITAQGRHRWLMNQARQYLQAHYAEPVTLAAIARALRVSPYHLSHVFSHESRFSLFEYLTHLRMEKARSLLSQGRMNVSEVAFAVGFDDNNYFSKVYRRHFGESPRTALHPGTQ